MRRSSGGRARKYDLVLTVDDGDMVVIAEVDKILADVLVQNGLVLLED